MTAQSIILPGLEESILARHLARIMHKFSTAATKSSALPALHSVGLLDIPYSTFAGASVARLVRSALSSLRDKNLCIIRARVLNTSISF